MLLAMVAGVLAYFMLFRPKATNKPNVNAPDVDVDDAANTAADGANTLADQISSWSPDTWRIIVALVFAGVLVWAWAKFHAFKWMVIGGFLLVLALLVFA